MSGSRAWGWRSRVGGGAQSGWLAHDYLHHQVFRRRSMNTVAGYFIGNVALVGTAHHPRPLAVAKATCYLLLMLVSHTRHVAVGGCII